MSDVMLHRDSGVGMAAASVHDDSHPGTLGVPEASRVPSVLAVTSEIPWPLNSGGHLRTFHLLRSISRQFRVRLVVPILSDQGDHIEALRSNGIAVHPVMVAPRAAW